MGRGGEPCRVIYPDDAVHGLVLALVDASSYVTVGDGKLRVTRDRREAVPFVFEPERGGKYALRYAGRYVAGDATLGSYDARALFAVRSVSGNVVAVSPPSVMPTGPFARVGETRVKLETRGNDPTFDVCYDREKRRSVVEAREEASLKRMRDTSCEKVVLPCDAVDRVRYPSCCAPDI
jgi:hypothetical protein